MRAAAFGHVDLRGFGARRELVAEALVQHEHQTVVVARVAVVAAHAAQLGDAAGGVDGVDQVPSGEVEIHAARHFARRRTGHHRAERAIAVGGQDRREFDAPVEVGARHVHAVAGEDVGLPVELLAVLRADPHHREVGGAAADVGDQHDLLAERAALVVERSGDRLVLEPHFVEAHLHRCGFERGLCLRVACRFAVDKEHRPAEHRAADRRAGRGFGAGFQVLEIAGNDVEVLRAAAAAHVGGLLEQVGAEDAFHRAHQPAFEAVDIRGHRGAAEGARRAVAQRVRARVALEVKHRRRHRRVAGLELDEPHGAARIGRRDGRIRRAEVDRAVHARAL